MIVFQVLNLLIKSKYLLSILWAVLSFFNLNDCEKSNFKLEQATTSSVYHIKINYFNVRVNEIKEYIYIPEIKTFEEVEEEESMVN